MNWCKILIVALSCAAGSAYWVGKRAGLKEAMRIIQMAGLHR